MHDLLAGAKIGIRANRIEPADYLTFFRFSMCLKPVFDEIEDYIAEVRDIEASAVLLENHRFLNSQKFIRVERRVI
jgi:hypothetical protein